MYMIMILNIIDILFSKNDNNSMNQHLTDLHPGDTAKIIGYEPGDATYRKKLLAMGLTPNTLITFVRRAPLGDPIQIEVRNAYLSLRAAEAKLLKVEYSERQRRANERSEL